MFLEQDIICIQSQINPEQRHQIFDIFLESISKSHYQQAIAIILSGAGDDGRKGASILRQSNGLLLVMVSNPVSKCPSRMGFRHRLRRWKRIVCGSLALLSLAFLDLLLDLRITPMLRVRTGSSYP